VKGPPGNSLASIVNTESGKYKNPSSKSKFINKLGGRTPHQQQTGGIAASRPVMGTVQQQQQSVLQLTMPSGGNVTVSPQTPTDSKYDIQHMLLLMI
jgi:hypothetical protein